MRLRQVVPLLQAKAGLQMSAAALMDDYPKAVRDGRTDAWNKAVSAVAEWYAYIDEHGLDGLAKTRNGKSVV